MASGDGVITRKDIITDEALSFGKEYKKNVEEAIKANDELISQFKILLKVSGDYRKAQDSYDYKKAKQEESLANQKILNELKQMATLEKELERIKQEKAKTEKELIRVAQENIRLSRQQAAQQKSTVHLTMEERVQRQLANKAEKEAVLNKMGLIGAYQKLNAQRTEAKKRLLDLIASEKASNAEIKKAQREFDVLDKKVRKADQAAGDFTKTVGNYKTAFNGLSNLLGAFGIIGGVTGIAMLGKSMYETTKQIQAQNIALKMLSETEETYTKNKDFLIRISEQYGLELMTTTNAYKNYFASSKTAIEEGKISFEDMQLVFEKVSKSASMLGLSVETQEGAFLALSQMLSKGTVQSEELRGQLGERLPGAFEVMVKALGVTTMELGKMLENGEVMAADVLPKFAIAYEKAIGADQINRTENLAAAQNRFTNEWVSFVEEIDKGSGAIGGFANGFMAFVTNALKGLNRISSSWSSLWGKANKQGETSGYNSAMIDYTDYNKFDSQRNKALKERQELLQKERKLTEEIKGANKGLESAEKRRIMPNWLGGSIVTKDANENLEKLNKQLGVTRGRIKAIEELENDFLNPKSENTSSSRGGTKSNKTALNKANRDREKAIREAEKLEKEWLKKEKETYEAGIDLLIWRANSEAEIYRGESINEKTTQEERYNALIESQKAEEESLRLNVEKQLTLSRAFQDDKKAFTEVEISNMLNNLEIRSDLTDSELLILEKYYANQEKLRKDNVKGLEQNLELELKLLKEQQQSKLLQNEGSMSTELDGLNIGNNLTDVENYEKAAYEIRRKYLLKEIEDNIAFYQSILQNENLTQKQKEENTKILLGLQEDLREFNVQSHVDSLQKAKEMEQAFMEIGENIKNALVELTNVIFDNRIQRIDEDIERTNEQYERQIELYEGDAARQKIIREQQEKEREKLEAKKRKEQHKQAVFDKAMSIMDIGFSTAMAIMQGYAQLGPIAGSVAAVLIGILGTVQTAAVLATPIPKYKMGRKGGPEEVAIVGDGGIHEVIEHKDGSAEVTPNRDTLVKLLEGDSVHSSIEEYRKSRRNKLNQELQKDAIKYQLYMNSMDHVDMLSLEKKLDELIYVTKSKKTNTTVNVPKVDLGHELWRLKQLGY